MFKTIIFSVGQGKVSQIEELVQEWNQSRIAAQGKIII